MRLKLRKLRIIFLAIAFAFGLCLAITSLPADSWLSWRIGTIKSELWAASQRLPRATRRGDAWRHPRFSESGSIEDACPIVSFADSASFGGCEPALTVGEQYPALKGGGLRSLRQRFDPDFESEKIATKVESTLISSIFPNRNGTDESMENNDFFPLGWYDSVGNLDTPAQIATEGIDFIVPYTGKSDASKVKAYLDRAAAVGIKVMVEIPRLEVRRDHRWLITHQFVKALKNHPAVYGWYLYDEPEFTQISPALLKRVYDAIKIEDPNHAVAIAFGRLERVKPYLQALDTLVYFRYPCYYDSPEFCGFEDGSFKDLAAEAAAFAQRGNFWMALQGYGEDKYGKTQNNRRLPSLEEERYMIYSAVLAPANGLLFWTHYRSQQQWIDGVLTPLIKELREYLPAITNRNSVVPKAVSDARVQTRLFRYPQTGDLLLVAINNSGQSFTTEMALQPKVRVNSAQVKAENRAIAIKEGRLTDVFEPFAVHVYQLQSD